MLKHLLTIGLVLPLLWMTSLPARAQTQVPTPQSQEQIVTDVSDAELDRFTNAIAQIQMLQQESRREMATVVQESGLSEQRFMEIARSQQNPESEIEVSSQERENFQVAVTEISQIQQSTQAEMIDAVRQEGLDVDRFNQILAAVSQDPELKEAVQERLGN